MILYYNSNARGEKMASYNKPILIQKLNEETEQWEKFCETRANVNKTGGREYTNASTNISASTYNFKVRYRKSLEEVIFNTEMYRVVYNNRCFDIKNVDRYAESTNELILIGDFNGKNYFN